MELVLGMYNVHLYFSLKYFGKKSVHYTQQNMVYFSCMVPGDRPKTVKSSIRLQFKVRNNFLPVRAVQPYNRIPQEVMSSPAMEVFKRNLDDHLSRG